MLLHDYLDRSAQDLSKGITFVSTIGDTSFTTYSDLSMLAKKILGFLQARGVAPKSKVILKVTEQKFYLAAYWACIYGEIIALCTPLPQLAMDMTLLRNDNTFLISDDSNIMEQLEVDDSKKLLLKTADILNFSSGHKSNTQMADTAMLIQFSSGSTGEPKGVINTHKGVLAFYSGMASHYQISGDDCFLSWLPLYHNMGLVGFHTIPILLGCSQVLIDTNLFRSNPSIWLECISRFKPTTTVSNCSILKPMTDIKTHHPEVTWDLKSIRVFFIAGEASVVPICDAFIDAYSSNGLNRGAISPAYGLTEATLTVSGKLECDEIYNRVSIAKDYMAIGHTVVYSSENGYSIASVGPPLPNIEVNIFDLDNRSLNYETIGLIHVRGDAVAENYYMSDGSFEPIVDGKGWHNTGDVGFIHNGELYILGRYKEIYIYQGKNYFIPDIERALEKACSLLPGTIAIIAASESDSEKEKLICFVKSEIQPDKKMFKAIRAAGIANLHLDVDRFVILDIFPQTSLGKLARFELTMSYKNGKYGMAESAKDSNQTDATIPVPLSAQMLCDKVISIFDDLLDKKVFPSDNIFDVCGDSMTTTIIYSEVEGLLTEYDSEIGTKVSIADIETHPTIMSLSEYMCSKVTQMETS